MPLDGFWCALRSHAERRQRVRTGAQSPLHRCLVFQCAMRSSLIVLSPPAFDDHPCFLDAPEDLFVQAFIAKLPDEALRVPVLPRMPGLDVHRARLLGSSGEPGVQRLCDALGAVVAPGTPVLPAA